MDIYPLTIVRDRYRGTYSGGKYTAWNLRPDEVPAQIFWDDCGCADFFDSTEKLYGRGATPEEAIKDLEKRLEERNEDFSDKIVDYDSVDNSNP